MSPLTELLPFVFLGVVIGIFVPMGNNSTTRGGVRPLSVPYSGDSLRTQSFVAGFMANFLNIIGHLVAALRSATIDLCDLTTTSLRRSVINAGSASTALAQPCDILRSKAQTVGWAGLSRLSFEVLSDLEGSLNAQAFEPIYTQYYVTSFLTILLSPNAITTGARANIIEYLVYNEITFNEEYLFLSFGDNPTIADFIIAAGNHISPVVIGLLHLAWSNPSVAQAFYSLSDGPSWDRYNSRLYGPCSIQQITHSVHCHTPIWPCAIPFDLDDGKVEYIAALFALAIFMFNDDCYSLTK